MTTDKRAEFIEVLDKLLAAPAWMGTQGHYMQGFPNPVSEKLYAEVLRLYDAARVRDADPNEPDDPPLPEFAAAGREGQRDGLCKSPESSTSNLCNSGYSSTQSELTWTKALLNGALAEIAVLKAAPEVAPPDEFNKAGGDLVADELFQGAYSWFREGWYARHKYTHPAPKADASVPTIEVGREGNASVTGLHISDETWASVAKLKARTAETKADAAADRDTIAVNLMRQCGLDKHKARECADVVLMLAASPARGGEGEKVDKPDDQCPFTYAPGTEPPPVVHKVIGTCSCDDPAYVRNERGEPRCWACAYSEANW